MEKYDFIADFFRIHYDSGESCSFHQPENCVTLQRGATFIYHFHLNPIKVDRPPFVATAAALLEHYQVDPAHLPSGLKTE